MDVEATAIVGLAILGAATLLVGAYFGISKIVEVVVENMSPEETVPTNKPQLALCA